MNDFKQVIILFHDVKSNLFITCGNEEPGGEGDGVSVWEVLRAGDEKDQIKSNKYRKPPSLGIG
jgi:hypothetical protein